MTGKPDGQITLSGWGRHPRIQARGNALGSLLENPSRALAQAPAIAHALGRSYGDSALAPHVIFTKDHGRLGRFDPGQGTLGCQSGASLERIVNAILPHGWFLPVVPGARHVTVGGAIASDVHGKNHHKDGCFSNWVLDMDILLADGSVVSCSRSHNPDLFRATCGGMGLTGIILSARLALVRVPSAFIRQAAFRSPGLDNLLDLFEAHAGAKYSVAWIDCLATGKAAGRSVLFLGEHAGGGEFASLPRQRLSVPCNMPGFVLNRSSMALFNALYHRLHARDGVKEAVPLGKFFFPLDAIGSWNRLYGPKGFIQYQLVVPKHEGRKALHGILHELQRSGQGAFLGVLKLLGPENGNYLSFPMEGYTLAVDFPVRPGLFAFLERLDALVTGAGGRLYLAKDARMPADVFRKGYPSWEEFVKIRRQYGAEGVFASLQSQRLGL